MGLVELAVFKLLRTGKILGRDNTAFTEHQAAERQKLLRVMSQDVLESCLGFSKIHPSQTDFRLLKHVLAVEIIVIKICSAERAVKQLMSLFHIKNSTTIRAVITNKSGHRSFPPTIKNYAALLLCKFKLPESFRESPLPCMYREFSLRQNILIPSQIIISRLSRGQSTYMTVSRSSNP